MNALDFYKSVLLLWQFYLTIFKKSKNTTLQKILLPRFIFISILFSVHKFQFSKVSFIFSNNLFISELRKGYLNPTLLLCVTWAIKIKEDSFYALLSPMR